MLVAKRRKLLDYLKKKNEGRYQDFDQTVKYSPVVKAALGAVFFCINILDDLQSGAVRNRIAPDAIRFVFRLI